MSSHLGRFRTALTSGCSSCPGACDDVCEGVGRTTRGSSLSPSPSHPQVNLSRQAEETHRDLHPQHVTPSQAAG